MKRIIKNLILILTLSLIPATAVIGTAYAACPNTSTSKGQVIQGIGETGSDCNDDGVTDIVAVIVRILSLVVGIAAVIMVIFSGFRYITSGGEAGKVANAKNTLIYALIGVLIAVAAQLLVRIVVDQSNRAVSGICASDPKLKADDKKCK